MLNMARCNDHRAFLFSPEQENSNSYEGGLWEFDTYHTLVPCTENLIRLDYIGLDPRDSLPVQHVSTLTILRIVRILRLYRCRGKTNFFQLWRQMEGGGKREIDKIMYIWCKWCMSDASVPLITIMVNQDTNGCLFPLAPVRISLAQQHWQEKAAQFLVVTEHIVLPKWANQWAHTQNCFSTWRNPMP